MEGGATRGGVTGGVTHAMSGGGGEVQQLWRVGPHRVVSQEVYVRWRRGGVAVGPHRVVSQEV